MNPKLFQTNFLDPEDYLEAALPKSSHNAYKLEDPKSYMPNPKSINE